jgi:NAD(P)-dependent dehydrogenase (short-subunit alcohol dehydrogenase family)
LARLTGRSNSPGGTNVASLVGRTVVVTGGNGGLGFQTAVALAGMGARLVIVGRDRARSEKALDYFRHASKGAAAEAYYADLSRLDEVRRLAATLVEKLDRIDVLVNNAGAIFNRREVTDDGLERTFALNHMGYFLLTQLLRDKLLRSAPARIVNVASEAHRGARLDFTDLQNSKSFGGWKAYRRSKLCNILFTRELARRLAGSGVTANCLHPGFCATSIGNNTTGWFRRGVKLTKRLFAIPAEQGARTLIYAASAPELADVTGAYFINGRTAAPAQEAQDDEAAERLWAASAHIAGLND